ncbi:uncharacterized protein Eint_090240 [Encephalitozoon intestinalis ATCC 50506]|uniref:DNA-directed RNA polymerase III subunit RPC3 n=1 Tax=Encephalitozoon intestinalis (strain ATCC 50506) TaxID=876142 RepID=E0S972_ENCIT|nr:uncharacterized protein Eint_090240 [Encephalitozoon intestinalis ATCC 50506]ADM12154.1 hypothetical protein Eint_090240 [Encephalitozoon intestinalis ATCC 50506]UTX45955.1 DNA-directed RNA polymerase III subunit RPC3 [Encephalitozoon intestinalis]
MPGLVGGILEDYGNIPQKIGFFLGKRNGSTIEYIVQNTSLTYSQVMHGLSLMIQRRLVRYFQYEKKVHYVLDVDMVYRRMYFGIYCNLIEDMFGADAAEKFMEVLIDGFSKADIFLEEKIREIIDAGMIIPIGRKEASLLVAGARDPTEWMRRARMEKEEEKTERKNRKTEEIQRFYIVDFGLLDSILINNMLLSFVRKRYLSKAEKIYRSILKCNLVSIDSIIGSFEEETSISRGDITSCIKYFSNCGLLQKSLDCSETYFKDEDSVKEILVVDILNRILSENSKEGQRIFNMMLEYKTLEDKDIVIKSLIPSYMVKKSLIMLHSKGFVVLKRTESGESKPVLQWEVNTGRASKVVREEIKEMLEVSWASVNQRWKYIGLNGDGEDEGYKALDHMLGLSLDFFILGVRNMDFKSEMF